MPMRDYGAVQRDIDAYEFGLVARGVDALTLGRAADCELAVALGVEAPARMPAGLEALYDERDAVGAASLFAQSRELRARLGAAGFGGDVAEAVLGCYSLDGRRVDAVGQYLACGGASFARGDWGAQADRVRSAAGLGRPEAVSAVAVVAGFFRREAVSE